MVRSVPTTNGAVRVPREQIARATAAVLLVALVALAGVAVLPHRDTTTSVSASDRPLRPMLDVAAQPLQPRIVAEPTPAL